MRTLLRPHFFLLVIGLLFLVAAFFVGSRTLDIHVHDTYIVIAGFHALFAFGLLFLLFALLYRVLRRWLPVRALSWIHILSLFLPVLSMLIYLYGFRKYVDFSTFSQTVDRYNSLVRYLIWFFLLGQLLFLVHLIVGLVRRNHGEGKKIR